MPGLLGPVAATVPLVVLIVAVLLPLWADGLIAWPPYIVLGPFVASITFRHDSLVSGDDCDR